MQDKSKLGLTVAKALLVLLLLALVCALIWFVGPIFSFGSLKPLESAGMRVTVIVLVLVLTLFVLLRWPVSVLGVLALSLLIWHAGPLLAFGSAHPLEPVLARMVVLAVLLVVYAAYGVYKLLQAIDNDKELLGRILRRDPSRAEPLAREDVKAMRGKAQQAVQQLKRMRSGVGVLRRLLEGRRYLYELPWYMIIGKPAAGKTTALLNSGLQFPLASQMGGAAALSTDSGTYNCDWWFTNEAVLVDTAGRMTDHDDGASSPHARELDTARQAAAQTAEGAEKGARPAPPPATLAKIHEAEWHGFLQVLRRVRTRAPINGALLAIDAQELMGMDAPARQRLAGALRARLQELRDELGIRFPVYVLLTKCDALVGFNEYFSALTTEGRSQVWGVSLPWQGHESVWQRWLERKTRRAATTQDTALPGKRQSPLAMALGKELQALQLRVADGVAARLLEEFEPERRKRLYLLPHEVAGLLPTLVSVLDEVFADSRFDATTHTQGLRGVYFTSAAQAAAGTGAAATTEQASVALTGPAPADPGSIKARWLKSLGYKSERAPLRGVRPSGQRSYFLTDLLQRVVFPEAHLVRPNLRWEARFRLIRWVGHVLVLVLLAWLAGALMLSHSNNLNYLAAVDQKTTALRAQVVELFANFKSERVPDTLAATQDLPTFAGLDLGNPASSYRYGLYSAEPIAEASAQTYASLQAQLLLPSILQRMESIMTQALDDGDTKTAYNTLRVYLMLHEKDRFNAADLRAWVVEDWQAPQGISSIFGGKAAMLGHLESLFSGQRVVQAASVPNRALVSQVRELLGGTTTSERLYRRSLAALQEEAPAEFSLTSAIGPQAGTVFARASHAPLEKGVPGIFTYDGYHEVFNKRLPEMVALSQIDDAWVMGRLEGQPEGSVAAQKKSLESAALAEEIRRQYLLEYTQQWSDFLDDVRVLGGANMAFDLSVLRQLASPNSPLARLARAAARETTLSRTLQAQTGETKSLFDKASEQIDKKANAISKDLGLRAEARSEKALVDDQFAALREVVTGQADAGALAGAGAGYRPAALEGITGLINEFYTVLVVADTAIAGGAVPPGAADVGVKLRMEAARLPAPFQEVLLGLGNSGADKVMQGAQNVLRQQAQAQMDRITGMLALQVSEPCRRAIDGKYPFVNLGADAKANAAVPEVSIEDFQQLFAAGGALDEYFNKTLLPYVDTSVRPWRYKNPATANMLTPADANGSVPAAATAGPTLTGELLKLLAASGPNPDVFARARQIREVFFRDATAKRLNWKLDVRVSEMDPSITDMVLDVDGQGQRYAHGPVQTWGLNWPGPRGGAAVDLTANPRIRTETSTIHTSGPWALLKLIERGHIVSTATSGRVAVEFFLDNRRLVLDIASSASLPSPLTTDVLKGFSCPGRSL